MIFKASTSMIFCRSIIHAIFGQYHFATNLNFLTVTRTKTTFYLHIWDIIWQKTFFFLWCRFL